MVLAPAQYHAALTAACRSSETLRFNVVNADTQCRASGLKTFPADTPCDALFLYAAATHTPAEQFAQEPQRHHYRLWQLSNGLYAAGMAMLAAGVLYAGAELFASYTLRQQIQNDQNRFDALSAEYARVTSTFPKTPTSTENLKTTIKQYQMLQAQTASPAYLLLETSKVLAAYPQVEIEGLEWHVGRRADEGTSGKGTPAKAAAPVPPAAGATEVDFGYELLTISARVVGARRTDVRAITEMASQFIEAFKKIPALEISGVNMPFEVTAEDTFKGDIGSERTIAEDARFSVTVGRKLGR
jgi:hypothetical protein